MRILRCVGAVLVLLAATAAGFAACLQAGAKHQWDEFRAEQLLKAGALLFTLGTPMIVLLAVLLAHGKRSVGAIDALAVLLALGGVALGVHALVLMNKEPVAGAPFAGGAVVLFVIAVILLSRSGAKSVA